jgi:hypothetical protein
MPRAPMHVAVSGDVSLKIGKTVLAARDTLGLVRKQAGQLKADVVRLVQEKICGRSGAVLSTARFRHYQLSVPADESVYSLAFFRRAEGACYPIFSRCPDTREHVCAHLSPDEIHALRSGTEFEAIDPAKTCVFCCSESLPPAPCAPAAEPWAVPVEVAPESVAIEMPAPTGCLPALLCGSSARIRKGLPTL